MIGGILRFETMAASVHKQLNAPVNVPQGDMVQFVAALGAAVLGLRRLAKLREETVAAPMSAGGPELALHSPQ